MSTIEPEKIRTRPPIRLIVSLGVMLIAGGTLAFIAHHLRQQSQYSLERKRQEIRDAEFEAVRQGDSSALVMDSRLLPMLAGNAECRKHVTSLTFAETEIDAADAPFVAQLSGVTSMTFYCTRGTQDLLLAARSLPVAELSFESPDLRPESYLILKDFPNLKRLRFEQVMDDAWIDRLKMEMPGVTIDAPYPASEQNLANQTGDSAP